MAANCGSKGARSRTEPGPDVPSHVERSSQGTAQYVYATGVSTIVGARHEFCPQFLHHAVSFFVRPVGAGRFRGVIPRKMQVAYASLELMQDVATAGRQNGETVLPSRHSRSNNPAAEFRRNIQEVLNPLPCLPVIAFYAGDEPGRVPVTREPDDSVIGQHARLGIDNGVELLADRRNKGPVRECRQALDVSGDG